MKTITWFEAKRSAEIYEAKAKLALANRKTSFPDFAMYVTISSDYYPTCIQPWEAPKPQSAQAFLPIGRYEGVIINICSEECEVDGTKYAVITPYGVKEFCLSQRIIKVDYSDSLPYLALGFAGLFASIRTQWIRVRIPKTRETFYFPYYK